MGKQFLAKLKIGRDGDQFIRMTKLIKGEEMREGPSGNRSPDGGGKTWGYNQRTRESDQVNSRPQKREASRLPISPGYTNCLFEKKERGGGNWGK